MTQEASKARGMVRWFSNEGDHGFVCPEDGGQDVHVRREHIVGDGTELLAKGDRVNYDVFEDAGGLWARNVSKEERRYSWRKDCLERHEGKEARHEYYAARGKQRDLRSLSKRRPPTPITRPSPGTKRCLRNSRRWRGRQKRYTTGYRREGSSSPKG